MPNHHQATQSGNAFWIILLAIALLVALTITITRSTESTEDSGTRDRNRIAATDIIRQAKSIQQAVEQLRLRGTAENQMNFDNSFVAGYANTRCGDSTSNTDDNPCKIFHAEGVGLTYKTPPATWLDGTRSGEDLYGEWYFYATACVPGIGTGGTGCSADVTATELMIGLPWIREDVCVEINRLTGVDNLSGPTRPPLLPGSAYTPARTKFTGTFSTDSEIDTAANAFTARQSGCFQGASGSDPDGGFHFYHVLIAR